MLSWPDMLVLTGLNTAFDRMLHLTAYVRTKTPKAVIVAGGPAIRNLPNLSKQYFDYICVGDMEELQLVIEDAFDKHHVSDQMSPRYDLAYWMTPFGYVESSRNCNFKCSFCSLTGEGHGYKKYDLEFVRHQITSLGKHKDPAFFSNLIGGVNHEKFIKPAMVDNHNDFTVNELHERPSALPADPWRPGAPDDRRYRAERNTGRDVGR